MSRETRDHSDVTDVTSHETHDPTAASYTDRVLFLADGLVVDELRDPTNESVLAKMSSIQRTIGS